MIERFHRTLNEALMTSSTTTKWAHDIRTILLGLRNRPSTDGISPSQRLYGTTPRLPYDLITPSTPVTIPYRHHEVYRKYTKQYYPQTMNTAKHVYIRIETPRGKLQPPYRGPYTILANDGKTVTYQDDKGQQNNVSVDRCKPAPINNERECTKPPKSTLPPTHPSTPSPPVRTSKGQHTCQKRSFYDVTSHRSGPHAVPAS